MRPRTKRNSRRSATSPAVRILASYRGSVDAAVNAFWLQFAGLVVEPEPAPLVPKLKVFRLVRVVRILPDLTGLHRFGHPRDARARRRRERNGHRRQE